MQPFQSVTLRLVGAAAKYRNYATISIGHLEILNLCNHFDLSKFFFAVNLAIAVEQECFFHWF